ncbi:hypothetical protein [Clostridium perfringens]|nr:MULTISPECIES: hypothetical protein [Clostridium]MDK7589891.1 hypothetical protein [Clostridium sp. UMB9555B]MDK7627715.1 hypothetical protein [Clostridium sp. UMB9555A]
MYKAFKNRHNKNIINKCEVIKMTTMFAIELALLALSAGARIAEVLL